jgi:hypothetical protein
MHNLKPIDFQNPEVKRRSLRSRKSRKIVIGLLGALIVAVMIVWLAFLGWGALEIGRSVLVGLKKLWTTLF